MTSYATERDRLDAIRMRPVRRQLRRQRLRQEVPFLTGSAAAVAFVVYAAAGR